jgi:hypothetical protein
MRFIGWLVLQTGPSRGQSERADRVETYRSPRRVGNDEERQREAFDIENPLSVALSQLDGGFPFDSGKNWMGA